MSEQRKVAPETVLNYLRACEEAYLIYRAKRFDVPSKRQLKIDEKYFIADHGIREAVFGNNERDIERVLENIVCLELLSRGYDVRIGRMTVPVHPACPFIPRATGLACLPRAGRR
ncbi:MAG: hypothetical protein LBO07_04605 [Coriobacteriales bacterium]|jgi:predicted AAA+ superfamily ATPase|nr:hypothetical protein [Coriobacteriales bacterium]